MSRPPSRAKSQRSPTPHSSPRKLVKKRKPGHVAALPPAVPSAASSNDSFYFVTAADVESLTQAERRRSADDPRRSTSSAGHSSASTHTAETDSVYHTTGEHHPRIPMLIEGRETRFHEHFSPQNSSTISLTSANFPLLGSRPVSSETVLPVPPPVRPKLGKQNSQFVEQFSSTAGSVRSVDAQSTRSEASSAALPVIVRGQTRVTSTAPSAHPSAWIPSPPRSRAHSPPKPPTHSPPRSPTHSPPKPSIPPPPKSRILSPPSAPTHLPSKPRVLSPSTSPVHLPLESPVHMPSDSPVHSPSEPPVHSRPKSPPPRRRLRYADIMPEPISPGPHASLALGLSAAQWRHSGRPPPPGWEYVPPDDQGTTEDFMEGLLLNPEMMRRVQTVRDEKKAEGEEEKVEDEKKVGDEKK